MNPLLASTLDHLVVMAASLDEGLHWAESVLGVTLGPGGAHPLMGTHNRLLKLSGVNYPASYLEVIALDPAATPQRAFGLKRWFDMDDAALRKQVARDGPQLITCVARCTNIKAAAQALTTLNLDCGDLVAASRQTKNALLQWRISVRDDGQRLLDGALPALIQWGATSEPAGEPAAHPTDTMPASDLQLKTLQLTHPDLALLQSACHALGMAGVQVQQGAPGMCAVLQTPRGELRLQSPTREQGLARD